jgi:hypothetical protein
MLRKRHQSKAVYEFINQAELRDLGIDSFMLIKNGKVVAEGYHPPLYE